MLEKGARLLVRGKQKTAKPTVSRLFGWYTFGDSNPGHPD